MAYPTFGQSQTSNYYITLPDNSGHVHSEQKLINKYNDMMKQTEEEICPHTTKSQKVDTVYLYTYYLPCNTCRDSIITELINKIPEGVKLYVGYSSTAWHERKEIDSKETVKMLETRLKGRKDGSILVCLDGLQKSYQRFSKLKV